MYAVTLLVKHQNSLFYFFVRFYLLFLVFIFNKFKCCIREAFRATHNVRFGSNGP